MGDLKIIPKNEWYVFRMASRCVEFAQVSFAKMGIRVHIFAGAKFRKPLVKMTQIAEHKAEIGFV